MRKIIIATAALAFLTTGAFAQDKPAASGDNMSKSEMSKMSKKSKHTKKSSMSKSGDDMKSGDNMKK